VNWCAPDPIGEADGDQTAIRRQEIRVPLGNVPLAFFTQFHCFAQIRAWE